MADEMVQAAQRFVNTTYAHVADIPTLSENGETGWSVMYALTRALQYELGLTALSNNFGPGTLNALQQQYPAIEAGQSSPNITRIVQSSLYCKGYDGSGISGNYDSRTASSVRQIKSDMGVSGVYAGDSVTPKVFKALLTMDPYVVVRGGSTSIRPVQQWMNGRYIHRQDFYIIPCDGLFSREVQRALMLAIQYEIGMADGVANGVFGPGTRTGLQNNPVGVGSVGPFVQLFTAAMLFNRRAVTFTDRFNLEHDSAVRVFQSFCELPVTGSGNYQTWASLLVSTGDPTRPGTACDCITAITPARADVLLDNGYLYVGRYLTEPVPPGHPKYLGKAIRPGELRTISEKGLRAFPIYQTFGESASYFTEQKGHIDALDAAHAAYHHGFRTGARIFFAVDFDALDHEVTSNIIPYFRSIHERMEILGNPYRVGIYGPRNVCSRVSAAGYATASFVSGMSTGFSGNLGYPLPENWAYDQISTITIGSGDGRINIDNNIASGRDQGEGSFHPAIDPDIKPDVAFNLQYWPSLLSEVQDYMDSYGLPARRGERQLTIADCLEHVVANDALYTSLSRTYGMRKALMQVSNFWEACHIDFSDTLASIGIYLYYGKIPGLGDVPRWMLDNLPGPIRETLGDHVEDIDDSSTGICKIRAKTAIAARNYCIRQGIISDTIRDVNNEDDVWDIWFLLNGEGVRHEYSMRTVPLIHIYHSNELGLERPNFGYSYSDTNQILRRYQGFGPEAEIGGMHRTNLYLIFEKYYSIMRNSSLL
ncbi:glycoside hydrolase domain-containing protein [Streptomyces xiamenensis]